MTKKNWNILVVDDEPNKLQLIRQILKDMYQLAVTTEGDKVFEIVNKINPDLILLDIMMPGIDGYEVCQQLKNEERFKDIPVIFITAMSN